MSTKIKKDGFNGLGKAKNRCKNCGRSFVDRKVRKQEKILRTNVSFSKYINEGYSVRQLADQRNKKIYIVRQDIQYRLDTNLIHCIDEIFSNIRYIIIDGYHMPGGLILLVYYEYIQEKVIWFSIRDGERKEYIVEDLKYLRDKMGYHDIKVCNTDGSPSIISALREVYINIIHQRCLVHIKRQVKTYISNHPKSDAGRQLKHIMNYRILSDSFLFPIALKVWEITYSSYLKEKSITQKGGWTYKHRNLRKAYKHICNAFPYMFQGANYKDSNIERTTNKLEGYFGVLTNEGINEHKGLSESRLCSFVALWIYERNYF